MIKYMPADSEQTCQAVSSAIHRLTRPSNSQDTTLYAFGWSQDVNDAWFMHFDLSMELPVHADRGAELEQVLEGFVQAGQLSPQSKQSILDLAATRVGQTVLLDEVVPQEWRSFLVDEISKPEPLGYPE